MHDKDKLAILNHPPRVVGMDSLKKNPNAIIVNPGIPGITLSCCILISMFIKFYNLHPVLIFTGYFIA